MVNNQPDKLWGAGKMSLSPTSLSSLRLKYCLDNLKQIKTPSKTKIKLKVLEVGCGAGMFCLAIHNFRRDLEIYGCDKSIKSLRVAKKRSKTIQFKFGDVYKLPYKNSYFDALVMFDVFEHLTYPNKALNEIMRVLKPGGIFHLYVPCEGNLYTLHGILNKIGFGYRTKKKYSGHVQQFETSKLLKMLKRNGLRVEKIRYSSHFLGQLIDLSYFWFLALLGHNVDTTVEGYVESTNKRDLIKNMLFLFKNILSVLMYVESSLLYFVPSHGVHLYLKKNT